MDDETLEEAAQLAVLRSSCWRAKLGRAIVRAMRQLRAAKVLQRWERQNQNMKLARAWRRMQYLRRRACLKVQTQARRRAAYLRVFRVPDGLLPRHNAAVVLQRHFRGCLARMYWARAKRVVPMVISATV